MLSCPECGSKNPDTHKFCRQCGAALTHKVCGECGAQVEFDRPECDRCGADVRTVLRAIVYPKAEAIAKWQQGTPLALDDLRATSLPERQRYRVVSSLHTDWTQNPAEIELKVWDVQPFDIPEARTDVPLLAKSYVALQSNWTSNAPPLHDCWQTDDETVILLRDRSALPLLVDRWGDNSVSWLQKLAWLEDMLDLWLALAELDCRASLLDLSNLRLDEREQVLCLQRLYRDPDTNPATLRDLGQVWELFYQESGQTLIGSMIALLKNLESGQIETIDRARLALQRIATEEEEEITEWSSATPKVDPTIVLAQLQALEVAGHTDIGQQRGHNEDTFSMRTQIERTETPNDRAMSAQGVYILCDGMGGHDGGEIASSLAVKTIEGYFKTHGLEELPDAASIRESLQRANDAIYELNQQEKRKGSRRMGTTLVMVLVRDTQVAIAHVGDSRCYSFSAKKGLQQLTTDHAVATRAILQGVDPEIAYSWINAYQLTQALGPRESEALEADVQFLELEDDTLFILGSDGLTDDDLLEMHCVEYLQSLLDRDSDLNVGAGWLIDLANRENGHDNITTILVRASVQNK